MTSRRTLIAANWKMNGDIALLDSILSAIRETELSTNVDTLICPPLTLLSSFDNAGAGSDVNNKVNKGAQNVSQHDSGAYTGEISVDMLKAVDCEYVLVGHSERREIYAETNSIVAEKFVQIARSGMKPILCLGETLNERESEKTENILTEQINAVTAISNADDWQNAVIAYEPIWAIGTGKTATPEMAQKTHQFIREYLHLNKVTQTISESIQILYGGSMKPANAAQLLAQKDIDGGLIGGASLDPDSFTSILKAAS